MSCRMHRATDTCLGNVLREAHGALRGGMALLEILIAVTMLVVAGTGWIALALQTSQSFTAAAGQEERVRAAAVLLSRYTRLPAAEIVAAAGRRRVGTFELQVSILRSGLFDLTIAEPGTGRTILRTTIYRIPTDGDDAP